MSGGMSRHRDHGQPYRLNFSGLRNNTTDKDISCLYRISRFSDFMVLNVVYKYEFITKMGKIDSYRRKHAILIRNHTLIYVDTYAAEIFCRDRSQPTNV